MAEVFRVPMVRMLKWPEDFHLQIVKGKESLAVELGGSGVERVGSFGSPIFSLLGFWVGVFAMGWKDFSTFDPGPVRF